MFQFGSSEQSPPSTNLFQGIHPTYPLYRPNPELENQRLLELLRAQNNYIATEITGVRESVGDFMAQMRGRMAQLHQDYVLIQRASELERPRKKFKKVIHCPIEDCPRHYSSKIALNCHIRTKHRKTKD